MGFGSNESTTVIMTNTPGSDLAYANLAYCSPADIRRFAISETKLFYASVEDSCVLSLAAHDVNMNGQIGLDAIHRRHLRVSTGDAINLSRFVLPEDFIVALLSVELEFVRKGTKSEQVDAVALAQPLRSKYMDQVLKVGQRVTFEYLGNCYIFRVNQAVVEGQKCSNNIEEGMMSKETNIVFEASHSSGIKIINQCEAASSNIFRHKEFNLKSLGIGGLSAEFADIF